MARCEKLSKCPFYQGKMEADKGLGAMYKSKYCEGDKESCARYQVATQVGPDAVPLSLYPNMNKAAEDIINKAK